MHKSVRYGILLAGLAAAAVAARPAVAQPIPAGLLHFDYFNAQSFRMADNSDGFIYTEGSPSLQPRAFEIGLASHYADELLTVEQFNSPKRPVIGKILTEDLNVAVGISDGVQANISIPWNPFVRAGYVYKDVQFTSNYLGDVRLGLKYTVLNRYKNPPVGIAFRVDAALPTGAQTRYLGDKKPGDYGATFIMDGHEAPINWGLNLGYRLRPKAVEPTFTLGGELRYSASAGLNLSRNIDLIADLWGSTVANSGAFKSNADSPLEADLGLRVWMDSGFVFLVGAGKGLTNGYGAPNWRVITSLSYRSTRGRDRDYDGVPDANDACPNEYAKIKGTGGLWSGCPNGKTANGASAQIGVGGTVRAPGVSTPINGTIVVQPGDMHFPIQDGHFRILLTQPRTYDFTFQVQGYKPVERRYSLDMGQDFSINIELEPASGK